MLRVRSYYPAADPNTKGNIVNSGWQYGKIFDLKSSILSELERAIRPDVHVFADFRRKGKLNFENKLSKAIDTDLMVLYRLARGGIRQAAFSQWLTTTLEMLILSELGPEHIF